MSEPDELFDVVDDENQVIDVVPRREVHRLGLKHRAVHVFLFRTTDVCSFICGLRRRWNFLHFGRLPQRDMSVQASIRTNMCLEN